MFSTSTKLCCWMPRAEPHSPLFSLPPPAPPSPLLSPPPRLCFSTRSLSQNLLTSMRLTPLNCSRRPGKPNRGLTSLLVLVLPPSACRRTLRPGRRKRGRGPFTVDGRYRRRRALSTRTLSADSSRPRLFRFPIWWMPVRFPRPEREGEFG